MSRRLTFVVLGITIFSQYTSFAATNVEDRDSEPLTASEKQARALAIFASAPRDPIVARASRIGGAGVAILSVDVHTGLVKAAWMDRSTGEKLLDDAALAAFRPWRLSPARYRKSESRSDLGCTKNRG